MQDVETSRRAPSGKGRSALFSLIVGLIAGAVVFAIFGGWQMFFLPAAISRGVFTSTCGMVVLGVFVSSAVIVTFLAMFLWRRGRALLKANAGNIGSKGSVALEFAMVFPIALMIFLVMLQSALLMNGMLCTNYASFCAARTAVRVLQERTADEGRNVVSGYNSSSNSQKVQLMWNWAAWAVVPVSCASMNYSGDATGIDAFAKFYSAYGKKPPDWIALNLSKRIGYAHEHTRLELHEPQNGKQYASNEDITVEVEHDFYLSIPYASKIFAGVADIGNSKAFNGAITLGTGDYAIKIRSICTLPNEGVRTYIGTEVYPSKRTQNED